MSVDNSWMSSDSFSSSLRDSIDRRRLKDFSPISSLDSTFSIDINSSVNEENTIREGYKPPKKPFSKNSKGYVKPETVSLKTNKIIPKQTQQQSIPSEVGNTPNSIELNQPKPQTQIQPKLFEKSQNDKIEIETKSPIVGNKEKISSNTNSRPNDIETFSIPNVPLKSPRVPSVISKNLRGYEVKAPKVTAHIDIVDYKKRLQEQQLSLKPAVTTQKIEEEKQSIKVPEMLYKNIPTISQNPMIEEQKIKEIKSTKLFKDFNALDSFHTTKFEKYSKQNVKENGQNNEKTHSINRILIDNETSELVTKNVLIPKETLSINNNSIEKIPPTKKLKKKNIEIAKGIELDVSKESTITNIQKMEESIKENEMKLSMFQNMLEQLIQQKEKEYEKMLSKTTDQFSHTITNSVSKMGIDMKNFYQQFGRLQKVTSEAASRFDKQFSDDQKKVQIMLNKQMRHVEEISSKIEQLDKKIHQIKEQKLNTSATKLGNTNNTGNTKSIKKKLVIENNLKSKENVLKSPDIALEDIHKEVSVKYPYLFKSPNWDESSPLQNLEFYQMEQKCLLDELVGQSFNLDTMKSVLNMNSFTPRQNIMKETAIPFSINKEKIILKAKSMAEKIPLEIVQKKKEVFESEKLIPVKSHISSKEIQQQFPNFAKQLLKFSVCMNYSNNTVNPEMAKEIVKHNAKKSEEKFIKKVNFVESKLEKEKPIEEEKYKIKTEDAGIQTKVKTTERESQSSFAPREEEEMIKIICSTNDKPKIISFQNEIDNQREKEEKSYRKELMIKELVEKEKAKEPITTIPTMENESYEGIIFTSNYKPRIPQKENPSIPKIQEQLVPTKQNADLIFEQYANQLVERALKYAGQEILGLYLHETILKFIISQNNSNNSNNNSNPRIFENIAGYAISPDLLNYCITNDIPFDHPSMYESTKELLLDFIKGGMKPIHQRNNFEEKEIEDSVSTLGDNCEKINEVILRLFLSSLMKNTENIEREHSSYNNSNTLSVKEKLILKPYQQVHKEVKKQNEKHSIEIQTTMENPISLEIQNTLKNKPVVSEKTEDSPKKESTEPYIPLPQLTFFMSDDTSAPITQKRSIDPPKEKRLSDAQTSTIKEVKEDVSCQTMIERKEYKISEVQTSIIEKKLAFTNTVVRSLAVVKPGDSIDIVPTKEESSEYIQSSHSELTSEEETENDTDYSYYSTPKQNPSHLEKTKVFASVIENDVERLLKLHLLKRQVIPPTTPHTPVFETPDTFDSESSDSEYYSTNSTNDFFSNSSHSNIDGFSSSSTNDFGFSTFSTNYTPKTDHYYSDSED
ncbi:hypothetical protein ABK040_007112 [Willaertia magna]